MGRRRKGRAISGWLVVDKPAGPTSTAIVGRVRRALDARKAGHAGTLDPTATGVLAVALGEATKTVPYVTDAQKVYRFTVRLGRATSTDDGEGEVVAESDARPEDAEIAAALPGFTGNIQQVPPQFSAVRVAGERAYDRARQGETLDLAPRPLHVAALEMVGRPDRDHVLLEMTCGKGGYVRSIARDLGAALGCHGHVVALRRVRAGPFAAESGVPLDRVEALAADGTLEGHLRPLEAGLADVAEVPCAEESVRRLRNGNPARVVATEATYGDTVWASHAGHAVAVGVYRAGELHPARVFAE